MKTKSKNLALLPVLITALTLQPVEHGAAQIISNVYSLNGYSGGGNPQGGVVLSGNTLYGTTVYGVTGYGAAFSVNTDGTGYTNLYGFTNGTDGANPAAGLILSGNTLYGTAEYGGASNYGTVFAVNIDGTGFTNLYTFTNGIDGANPVSSLVLSGSTLYGTAEYGGSSGAGTVFAISTNGMCFSNLYTFTYGSDGAFPLAGLILSGSTLYGTAESGGDSGVGTVFSVDTNGMNFTTWYSFTGGSDGEGPVAGLILSGTTLYGTAENGGGSNDGTVFSFDTNAMVFTTLYSFTGGDDGANPVAGLVLSGNILYGTTENGGGSSWGAVFGVNTNGMNFMTVLDFTNYSEGIEPQSGLTLSGLTVYGTTYYGGNIGWGEVYSILLPCPAITIGPASLPDGAVGVEYEQTLTPSGGVAPITFALTPGSSLPSGWSLSAGGVLSGTATSDGIFNFGVAATDANGCSATNSYSVNVAPPPLADVYSFSSPSDSEPQTNSDGALPSGVIISGNVLYGTTEIGGTNGNGAVFAVNTDGSNFTNLYSFSATSGVYFYSGTNGDGAYPAAGLILSGNTLYGTTEYGGAAGLGTIFAINIDGSGFTNLHSFTAEDPNTGTNCDGANPVCRLFIAGGTLYGTAQYGGASGDGTVFSVRTDGSCFSNLYSFTFGSDGAFPAAGLVISGKTLYGTAVDGGDWYNGTVFSIKTNGECFTTVYSFSEENYDASLNQDTNGDGAYPVAGLILAGSTLYGTAQSGGVSGSGTVFSVNICGTCFTNLYSFSAPTYDQYNNQTNVDGFNPNATLVLSGDTLYGTAPNGGVNAYGTVFALLTNGTDFTTLFDFNFFNGAYPEGGMVFSEGILYGTAENGGVTGNGTVFSLSTCPLIILSPGVLPNGNLGNAYEQTFAATGGVAPYSFAVTEGALPGGLSLSAEGVLSGTPTNIAIYNFTVTATDANGCTAANAYTMNVYAHFAVVHAFTPLILLYQDYYTNAEGANPYDGLVLSGNTLYGTASGGGIYSYGTVFAVNTDGTGVATLHTFEDIDGEDSQAALALSGSTLYGLTEFGGKYEEGTLFALNNDGTDFTNTHAFEGLGDGYEPVGRLLISGNTLFGTTRESSSDYGVLFMIPAGETNLTPIHTFTGINGDGETPEGGLILSADGTTLYGATQYGGTSHDGIIFSVSTNGMNFTNLYNFTNGSDGAYPNGALVLSADGSTLYGTAYQGGSGGYGTAFSVQVNGSNFTTLHSFTEGGIYITNNLEYLTNADGGYPYAGLILSGNTLYGTATSGGGTGVGTIFSLHTDGSDFTTLYSFTNGNDGSFPEAPLILVGNILYGTAEGGGTNGDGTVFAVGLGGPNPAVPPVVTWATPSPITYGTPLSSVQLDATASVPGNFAYDPFPGTVLNIGTNTLSVIFTPLDTADYSSVTNTVNLVVQHPPLIVTANNAIRPADEPNPVFTGTIVGLVNGDNITAVYNCSATSNSPPGNYPIVPTLVDPDNRATNYTVTLIDGTLTVNPIPAVFNLVHGFTPYVQDDRAGTNGDGAVPLGGLILSGSTLYGTASAGGAGGTGTVFAVNITNFDFTNLYEFAPYTAGCCGFYQNVGGMSPSGTLLLSNNTLFGPAEYGGNGYVGTLFSIETNSSNFANPHVFQNVFLNNQNYPQNGDGAYPYGGMVLSADGSTLFGTTIYGGDQGGGVVFAVNVTNFGFTNLHYFPDVASPNYTNSDGTGVFSGLALSADGTTVYGAAQEGGTNGNGTVFAVNVYTMAFTNLHNFAAATDGGGPDGTLILVGSTLYGTTDSGGSGGKGTVFAINTDGSGFTNLHNFPALDDDTNSDGAEPLAGLVLSTDGTTLYGTTVDGGTDGFGTVYAITTNGGFFTNLYNFTGGYDGANPESALVIAGYSLYGTASYGGNSSAGTIYSLTFPPPLLSISLITVNVFNAAQGNSGQQEVVLSWPVSELGFSFAGFTLQSTTNLSNLTPADWSNVNITPYVQNGQYTVTTGVTNSQTFYRLYQLVNP